MRLRGILMGHSIRQIARTPVRAIALLMAFTLVCAFLHISLTLRQVWQDNQALLEERFPVVAVPSFQGSVNSQGELTSDSSASDYQGFLPVAARDFDLSLFQEAAGVEEVLVHRQFGAYLRQEGLTGTESSETLEDVFIFTYLGESPVEVEMTNSSADAPLLSISLDWSALGLEKMSLGQKQEGVVFHNAINILATATWRLSPEDESVWLRDDSPFLRTFTLQPGQQYIACGAWSPGRAVDSSGQVIASWLGCVSIKTDAGHAPLSWRWVDDRYASGWYAVAIPSAMGIGYPCVMPYTEDFWETEAGAYFRDAAQIAVVNANALTVVATDDLSLFAPFYSEGVYVSQGRSFTREDYEQGSRVCLVSAVLAERNGWQLGDTLDLAFFQSEYSFNDEASDARSCYEPVQTVYDAEQGGLRLETADGFFDSGLFEIVGFYDGNVTRSQYSDDLQYTRDEGLDRSVVLVPQSAVSNLPEVPLSQYNTTILLDDQSTLYFLSDMEASGLTGQQKGQYQVSFTVYDRGLGSMKQSLLQLDAVSRLTLYLALGAALAVVVLLSVLTVLRSRREIAILRSMGLPRRQVTTAVLSGLLLLCLTGALLGGLLGHQLAVGVADYLLDTALLDQGDLAFSVLAGGDTGEVLAFVIESRWGTAVLAAGVLWLALALLCRYLTLREARKPPMRTLGATE